MIKYILYIAVSGLIVWNVVLTRKISNQPLPSFTNRIYDSLYVRHERRLNQLENSYNFIDSIQVVDNDFIKNANRRERDSLRRILNP